MTRSSQWPLPPPIQALGRNDTRISASRLDLSSAVPAVTPGLPSLCDGLEDVPCRRRTSTTELRPGSVTVAENAARREGVVLDALFAEYEPFLPQFQSFTDSNTAKHFFSAVEPALLS